MKNEGFVKLYRSIFDMKEWLSEPFTRAQAWVDLILLANYTTGYIRRRGILVAVDRGCVGYSERELALRWRWSREKVRRFLFELKTENRIEHKISQKTGPKNTSVSSLIYLIKYDEYQRNQTENETENETEDGTRTKKNNKEKKENKKDIPPISDDIDMEIWKAFLEVREQKKAPNTPHAIKQILTKLDRIKAEQRQSKNDVLNQSIVNGWKGVFAIKEAHHGNNRYGNRTGSSKPYAQTGDIGDQTKGGYCDFEAG